MIYGEQDTAILVKAAASGDALAWNELVDRYAALVWAITRSHRLSEADAADVSQMVWLELVERLATLRHPERLGAWLAAVTRHECLRMLRRSGRESPVPDEALPEADASHGGVDDGLMSTERRTAVRRAIASLAPLPRSLMTMLMSDPSPTYDQVAAALRISTGSVGPTRRRAMRALSRSPHLATLRLDSRPASAAI